MVHSLTLNEESLSFKALQWKIKREKGEYKDVNIC